MVKREPLPNQSFKMGNQSMGRKSGRLRAKIELSSASLSPPFFCLFFYSDGGAFNGLSPPAVAHSRVCHSPLSAFCKTKSFRQSPLLEANRGLLNFKKFTMP